MLTTEVIVRVSGCPSVPTESGDRTVMLKRTARTEPQLDTPDAFT